MPDQRTTRLNLSSTAISAIALALGLLVQTAGIVWWGGHIDERMTNVEEKLAAGADTASVIARLDERTNSLLTTVNRIDARQNAQDDARLNRK